MPRRYFTNFPEISYNGFNIKDITVSAAIVDKYVNLPYSYYRLENDVEQRPDQIATEYYTDAFMSWTIFYANKIVDPYYQWYINENDFAAFLIKKYGSIETSIKTILEFRTNWYNDSRELSPDQFDRMFGEFAYPHSRYWDTNYSEEGQLMSYTRKVSEEVVNTNKVSKLKINNQVFKEGDLIDIKTALNSSTVGTAEILSSRNGLVYLKNIIGDIQQGFYLVNDANTSINALITEFNPSYVLSEETWTRTNISPEEYVYWEPYTLFDMEREKNDLNKSVKMIDPRMAISIANRIEDELNGR